MVQKGKGKVGFVSNLISRVFDPVVEIPVALIIAVYWAVENGFRWRFLILLLLIDAVLPFLYFVHMLRKGEVSNWDIRDRKERIPLYLFTLVVHFIGLYLAWILGKESLFVTLLIFYVVAIVFMLITTVWKISLHAGVNSLLITFVNIITGWRYVWLYVIVVIVSWARVRDGHHSWGQVSAGAILAGIMVWVGLMVYGV